MDDLKKLAAPKTTELIKAINEQNEIMAVHSEFSRKQNNLLRVQIKYQKRLCDQKQTQQDRDDSFRDKWWGRKVLDTRGSMVVLFVMTIGVGLDVIKVNGNSSLVTWILSSFN